LGARHPITNDNLVCLVIIPSLRPSIPDRISSLLRHDLPEQAVRLLICPAVRVSASELRNMPNTIDHSPSIEIGLPAR
jgi:hypothetical protein